MNASDAAHQIARDFIEHGKTWITDEKALQLAHAYIALSTRVLERGDALWNASKFLDELGRRLKAAGDETSANWCWERSRKLSDLFDGKPQSATKALKDALKVSNDLLLRGHIGHAIPLATLRASFAQAEAAIKAAS